ncbi:hypothetical protein MHBO_001103 [Bonamia ostreae]|uniref:Uncharacterized protein n=1 Tax=Bonamia ostreae TaxID=126728 RepID=A0ABV2AIH8_9EUKA
MTPSLGKTDNNSRESGDASIPATALAEEATRAVRVPAVAVEVGQRTEGAAAGATVRVGALGAGPEIAITAGVRAVGLPAHTAKVDPKVARETAKKVQVDPKVARETAKKVQVDPTKEVAAKVSAQIERIKEQKATITKMEPKLV